MKIETIVYKNIWNKFPSLRPQIRRTLNFIANLSIRINRTIGNTYTTLFNAWGGSWFDHRYDYLRGMENYHWMERAFLALEEIKSGNIVLNIGCGDGSFDGLYYADKAKSVLAIDKDPAAISHAKKYYKRSSVSFVKWDVTKKSLPRVKFDVIFMFAVIEHFSKIEGVRVLENIKKSLKPEGIFFGSTPIFKILGKSNWEHQNEFTSKNDLKKFLSKVFNKVTIKERGWADGRRECYFECKA